MSAFAQRALIVTFPPVPLLRERVTLGFMYVPGGQNQDLFPSYSRALGPIAIKICKLLPSIVHRLVPAYLFGAVIIDCPAATVMPD